jgi:pyruvate dehydrogenase (quinone)
VTWEQRVFQGDPVYRATRSIPDFLSAGFAEMIGLHGVRVDDPERIGEAWDEVLQMIGRSAPPGARAGRLRRLSG